VTAFGAVLAWLDSAAFSLLHVPVSWAEVLGDVTGGLCVWLLVRQNLLTWPLGLSNNVFWGLLFFRSKLYADTVLQGVFFAFGVYGWWQWRKPGVRLDTRSPVRRTTRRQWWRFGAIAVPATALTAWLLARFTDSPAPVADASVLTLSLVATFGQAHRLLESWLVWIAVDMISVPLYLSRGLYPTALLFVIFGVLCVVGLLEWSRSMGHAQSRPAPPTRR
jgi:nicotinamide mononucleotide transporter